MSTDQTRARAVPAPQTPDPFQARAADLLSRMTLAEKIGQMTQVEKNSITPAEVTQYFIGSVLSGGGGNPSPNLPETWADMVHRFQQAALQTRLHIPLIYGTDAIHGHNNVRGAVISPHGIGLGATHDPDLVARVARVTALEMLATGAHWDFAPTVAVPQDIRWGRTYENFGQETSLVTELGLAYLRGLQEVDGHAPLAHRLSVLGSPKHFIGDGGTDWGDVSHLFPWTKRERPEIDHTYMLDQGNASLDEPALRRLFLPPYQAAIEAGCRCIMVSFTSWRGVKMHAHKALLTDILKAELGFDGFLVSDWMAINQIAPEFDACVVAAINAGLDMIMVPYDFRQFVDTLTRAVECGDVPLARIDDAVRRILSVKLQLGLFDNPYGDPSLLAEVGSAAHRQVAREAVRKSLVLLKHDNAALPLPRQPGRILLAGQAVDNVGLQCGGWTIEWLGGSGRITEGTTLLEAVRAAAPPDTELIFSPDAAFADGLKAPFGIVTVHEPPYAEGMGDSADLALKATDLAVIARMRARCDRLILVIFSGRPLIITDILPAVDAVVAAWLPGTEGQGITDILFGDSPFTGRLSFAWPRSMAQVPLSALNGSDPLFPIGYGLSV